MGLHLTYRVIMTYAVFISVFVGVSDWSSETSARPKDGGAYRVGP